MKASSMVTALLAVTAVTAALLTRDSAASTANTAVVTRIGEMNVARAGHQATLLKSGEVLITGGCSHDGCTGFQPTAEIHEPVSRTFRTAAPMSLRRVSHTAVLLQDGRVLVAGGCSVDGPTAHAELYDADADRWLPAGTMTEPRCSHVAVRLNDGRVFMMGGGSGRLGDLDTAELFDPQTATFSPLGRMRHNHYLATLLSDGRVLLTGGQDDSGGVLATAEIFDPRSGRFVPTGTMAIPRVKHAAALLPDGRVLIIGGSDERGYRGRFSSTEVYDPADGAFSPGPMLRHGRHKIRDAVVLIPSGQVVVGGGAAGPEIHDPAKHSFVSVRGELSGPLMFATAVALNSGEVLVLGGYDDRIRVSASAWIIRTDSVQSRTRRTRSALSDDNGQERTRASQQ